MKQLDAGKTAPQTKGKGMIFFYCAQFFFGGWFLFHGLNHYLHFFNQPSGSGQGMKDLINVLIDSGMFDVVKILEILTGALMVLNRFVPLAIVLAFPITVVISFMNFTMGDSFGIVVGWISIILNIVMALGYMHRYLPMLAFEVEDPSTEGLEEFFQIIQNLGNKNN